MTMSESKVPTVSIPSEALDDIARHAFACFPEECCGLLVGDRAAASATRFVPTTNIARSAKVYTIDPKEHLKAELAAEAEGLEIIGVVHSHTHTQAYPSPTDVAQAVDPGWHYVIVSLMTAKAEPRCFLIADGEITEESIRVVEAGRDISGRG